MSYEEFLEYVETHILDGMEENMKAVIKEVKKNNNIVLKALVVAKNETDIFYNIYLEDYYMEYCQKEKSLDEILLTIRENHLKGEVKEFLPFDLASMKEENIVGCIVSLKNNEEFLKDLPFIPAGDFAVIFKYYINELAEEGAGTILVTDGMAERKGYTRMKLLELALENTPKHFPLEMYHIKEVLLKLMSEELLNLLETSGMITDVWYLTNKQEYDGAFTILYPETKEKLLNMFQGNIICLPVSINEWILFPEERKENFGNLEQLVMTENEKMIQKENILGERAYLLKREDLLTKETMLLKLLTPVIDR